MAASIWWPGGRGTKAAMTVFPDGVVEVRCGTQDLGTGTRTHVAAVVAEELGIEMKWVRPLIGDSNYPRSGGSGGSTTSPSVAPAIKNTTEKAKAELTGLAARHFGVDASDIMWRISSVTLKDQANKKLSWKELCSLLDSETIEVQGEWVEGLSSAGVAGCQFAEVAVDTDTGRVTVLKVVAVADCGLVLNRLTTESQIIGGIIQGASYALFEDRLMDPNTGSMVNPEYENYKIVGTLETPPGN
jgi:xanthine dehydrogenase YagR molybdenum-binding subunit